jgi:HD-GYP domain-containing protein (c-di-GMP phosphodiesterase class II)
VAVADVIEAMTSYRPYRPRFDIRVALSEIIDHAGTLYDPDVCDAAVSLFREDHYHMDDAATHSMVV